MGKLLDKAAFKDDLDMGFNIVDCQLYDLDQNFQLMIHDFTTLQKAMNHMHKNVVHLQELNRDVMVGKRNTNCISCGTGPARPATEARNQPSPGARAAEAATGNYESVQQVQGQDGRMYVAGSFDGRNRASGQAPDHHSMDADEVRKKGGKSPKHRRRIATLHSSSNYKRIDYTKTKAEL